MLQTAITQTTIPRPARGRGSECNRDITSTDWRENSNLLHQIKTYFNFDVFLDGLIIFEGWLEFPAAHGLRCFLVEAVSNSFFDFNIVDTAIEPHGQGQQDCSGNLLLTGLFAKV